MKKITVADIVGIVSLAFIAWVFASWFNIIMHNTDSSPMYSAWNFFTIFFR